jgi:hypothetical protein
MIAGIAPHFFHVTRGYVEGVAGPSAL